MQTVQTPRAQLMLWAVFLVVLAVAGRVAPYIPNFQPMAAVALFAGFMFRGWLAWIVPIVALVISDLVLGFYNPGEMALVYMATLLAAATGRVLRYPNPSLPAIGGATLAAALVFFIVSNFGVWLFGSIYPFTFEGLIACYVAAIPFAQYTLAGTALGSVLLFGAWFLIQRFGRAHAPQSARR